MRDYTITELSDRAQHRAYLDWFGEGNTDEADEYETFEYFIEHSTLEQWVFYEDGEMA